MASSSSNAISSSLQRFNDYLDCLREEFQLQLDTSTKSPHRFDIYLGNLKDEFELMANTLRKERGGLEAKVAAQAKELQDVRHNYFCQRCRRTTTSSTSPIIDSSQLNASETAPSSSSESRLQSQPLRPSISPHAVNPSQQTLLTDGKPTSTRPSPFVTDVISRNSDLVVTHSQTSPHAAPASIVDHLPGPDRTITFNTKVGRELNIEMAHLLSHGEMIWCVKFSRDGKYLATGCHDGKTYVYDVESGTLTRVLRNLLKEKDHLTTVCFSRDGNYLATGSGDGSLYIWEIKSRYVRNAFKGHTRFISSLDFSPNGRLLVSASGDDTVRLWNMHDGATRFLIEDDPTFLDNPHYSSAVFSPDGLYTAASNRDGIVRIWDVRTGQLMRRLKAHTDSVCGVAFMPDGMGLVTGSWDNMLMYWDITSLYTNRFCARSKPTNDLRGEVEEQTRPDREFAGHKNSIYSFSSSHDGKWLVSGSRDNRDTLCIWHTRDATMQCSIKNGQAMVFSVDFSPAGRYLASGGHDGMVRIWRYSDVTL